MRGSMSSQVGFIISKLNGIGSSKSEFRSRNSLRSLDGSRSVSPKIHSFEYKNEVFRTGCELGNYARSEFSVKDFTKVDGKVLYSYIDKKIEQGVSRETLQNYCGHLTKIEHGLQQFAHDHKQEYVAFDRDDLRVVAETISNLEKSEVVNRAYENPGAIISNLAEKEHIVGQLQLEYGLRVAEATHIKSSQLQGNRLTYQGKGGYERAVQLSSELVRDLRDNMKNGRFEVSQNEYRNGLKESARIEGESYNGSHGLRYNFAQENYTKELENGIKSGLKIEHANTNALLKTSKDLGHHREEITLRYL